MVQPHILLPVVYFPSFYILFYILSHKLGESYSLYKLTSSSAVLFIYVRSTDQSWAYVAGRGEQHFFTCCPARCIAFI
jgi:hypothetical protein